MSLSVRALLASTLIVGFAPGLVTAAFAQSLTHDAIRTLQAEARNGQFGTTTVNKHVTNISTGDWLRFDNVNLGAGFDSVMLRYSKSTAAAAGYELRLDSPTGPVLAEGPLEQTDGPTNYKSKRLAADSRSGTQSLFLRFTGPVDRVNWAQLGRAQRLIYQAERADVFDGTVVSNRLVISDSPNEYIAFTNDRRGQGFKRLHVRYARGLTGDAGMDVHFGSLNTPAAASIPLPSTGSFETFRVRGVNLNETLTAGRSDVFFKFTGDGDVDVDWVDMRRQPLTTVLFPGDRSAASNMNFFFGPGGGGSSAGVDGNPAWLRFNNVSLSYNPEITVSYARGSSLPMTMEVRNGGPNGKLYGTVNLPNTGSYDSYTDATVKLTNDPQGFRNIVLVFKGSGGTNLQSFEINRLSEGDGGVPMLGEVDLDHLLVDQFGYKPGMTKVAVIRDGITGFGSSTAENYVPGTTLQVINAATGRQVFSGNRTMRNGGGEQAFSGDRAWWFNFSQVNTPGEYYIYDAENDARSATFEIGDDVYDEVLKTAFRTFLYQRSGFDKRTVETSPWADTASHLGPNQDQDARFWNTSQSANRKDLRGGWYDAGDLNKYTNWTANYILCMLHAYRDTPDVWGDDFDMPNSGNGISDMLDEIRWGVESLVRHQQSNGSVISVLESSDDNSPPSSNTGQSRYGPPTTSATLSAAAAFAFASKVFDDAGVFPTLASDLEQRAIDAYSWAQRNPAVKFCNESNGVAAGEQEDGFSGNCGNNDLSYQQQRRRIAAIYLYDLTRIASYQNYISNNWRNAKFNAGFVQPDVSDEQTAFMYYTSISGGNRGLKNSIRTALDNAFSFGFGNYDTGWATGDDIYRAYMVNDYANDPDQLGFVGFGSNRAVSHRGVMYQQMNTFGLGPNNAEENKRSASGYLHYIHGVNPFGLVYLSNMDTFGAERSADEFYHTWFNDGTDFDNARTSLFGPAPGFLLGGPNPNYAAAKKQAAGLAGQPPLKVFRQSNQRISQSGVDLTPWELNENSNGYQIAYLRLLASIADD